MSQPSRLVPTRSSLHATRTKVRRQRPLEGGRLPVSAGLEPRIEAELAALCVKFGASRPLVITTLLCKGLGIALDPADRAADYEDVRASQQVRRRS